MIIAELLILTGTGVAGFTKVGSSILFKKKEEGNELLAHDRHFNDGPN